MKKLYLLLSIIFFAFSLVITDTAYADDPKPKIRDEAFSASYVTQSIPDPIVIEAGKTRTVDIKFKNVGRATWSDGSNRYVSAYTMDPRYRKSVFIGGSQTAKVKGNVKPGEIGVLSINLTAPKETGEYIEEFYLASENYSWVKGGYFYLKIQVVNPTATNEVVPAIETTDSEEKNISADTVGLKGKRIGQTKRVVRAKGGEEIDLKLLFQNIGEDDWEGYRLVASVDGNNTANSIAANDWTAANVVLTSNDIISAKKAISPTFKFLTPAKAGKYTAQFTVEGVEGATATVEIIVTDDASSSYKAPKVAEKVEVEKPKPVLIEEPRIRVGLTGEGNSIQVVSYEDDYRVMIDGEEKGILNKNKLAIISHIDGVYTLRGGGLRLATQGVFRLEPINNLSAKFQVTRGLKDRRVAWVGASDFITYRGAVEYRQGERDKNMYVVNDLLLEDYVAGIAETGKNYDIDAVKANIVAARTYAFMSLNKYPFFDILGSTFDQLYLGADVETFMPKVLQAAKDTRGEMVSYNGEIVITPYFGNSNGKTKSWSDVWGGSLKPWLVPVVAVYDKGIKQFGHGVGMSQRDMALRAQKDDWDYKQLLNHYYTNTNITLMYQ